MDSSVQAVARVEMEELRGACLHPLATRLRNRGTVTWEVAAAGVKRILDRIARDGHWRRKEEMGIRCQNEANGYQSRCVDVEEHAVCSERVCAKSC